MAGTMGKTAHNTQSDQVKGYHKNKSSVWVEPVVVVLGGCSCQQDELNNFNPWLPETLQVSDQNCKIELKLAAEFQDRIPQKLYKSRNKSLKSNQLLAKCGSSHRRKRC